MYNACELNRWTACRMGPNTSVASEKNIFLLHLFPFAIGLQKDAVKEAKIKEKAEVAIHGPRFQREIGSLILKLKQKQHRKKFNRTKNTQNINLNMILFQTWKFRILYLKKKREFLTDSSINMSQPGLMN